MPANGYRVSSGGDVNVLKLDNDDGRKTLKATELYILKG